MAMWGERPAVAAPSAPRIWSFAGCVVDERTLELAVAGKVVDLDRKPLEVLLHLLRHSGEVVTKDELAEAVWPGRIITDSNLTKTVAVVRSALGEAAQSAIKTVHGYGYRLVAPVSVQVPEVAPVPAWTGLKQGDSPPGRAEWRLTECLASGGQADVWLAVHGGTGERRVFKFADGPRALTALKREITLYRLLRETLPDRDDCLRLLDWSLEQPPFFLATEYAEFGNLSRWAEARGGPAAIPLSERLELLAQVADALAGAHSVGVLHKDLKPANVLVFPRADRVRVKLADFGSGGVLDRARLEAAGITQMGFTRTVHVDAETSGTPVYFAPEVIAGQPFTVQSDIYALGVMLYQFVAGDVRKVLAPGWEKDIEDDVLREDIALAAAGNPAERLGDAGLLAQRLRDLHGRWREREAQRATRMQAERAQRMRHELRRLRFTAASLLILATAAVAAGVVAYQSRNEARRAQESAEAVNQFLNRDLLAKGDPRQGPTRDLTVRQLLDAAAASVGDRFRDQPDAEAQVRATLAEAYRQLDELKIAQEQLERAIELYSALYGRADERTLETLTGLAFVLNASGKVRESCEISREVQSRLERELDAHDERRLVLRAAAVLCLFEMKELERAIPDIRAVVSELEQRGMENSDAYMSAIWYLANAHFTRMDFDAAESLYRKLVTVSERRFGKHHITTARRRAAHANSLTLTGRLAKAETELARAMRDQEAWMGSSEVGAASVIEGILRLEQGRFAEAEAVGLRCLDSPLGGQKRGTFRLAALYVLGEAMLLQGRVEEAARIAEETVALNRELGIAKQFHEVPARAIWADALGRRNRIAQAWAVLNGLTAAEIAALPERNAFYALFRRSEGLLWMKEGKVEQARAALRESLEIYELRFGPEHWRTQRARMELARLPPA